MKDNMKYFITMVIEKNVFFTMNLTRRYCDKECRFCKKCFINNAIRIIDHNLVDTYEKYFINHHYQVADLCAKMADSLRLNGEKTFILIQSALLHDIGKLLISQELLFEKKKLSELDFREIKKHSFLGACNLKGRGFSNEIVETVKSHHERYDGNGYPDELKSREIPYLARILSVCDAFDAMISGRHYKEPLSISEAIGELKKDSGTQFDPNVVDEFISVLEEEAKVV